jgi:hypothetical protein
MSSAPPAHLNHYTSPAGMMGMLGRGQIWLTSIHYLNDSKEYLAACDRLFDSIRKAEAEKRLDSDYADYLREITKNYSATVVYVMSFCEKPDQLSLWRGYCPSGPGFSVSFDSDFLKRLAKELTAKGDDLVRLEKCVYEKSEHEKMADGLIARILGKFPTLKNDQKPDILTLYANELVLFAPLIKDEGFTEEQEWRLCLHPKSLKSVAFRPGKSFLIPYLEIKLDTVADWKNAIKRITIGPTPHLSLSSASVATFLKANNFNACGDPVWSVVPYRTW